MIIIERTITIKNDQATLDKPIYLYIEDGDITCLFTINEKEKTARFGSINKTDYSIIDNNNIDYGQVRIYKPDSGSDSTSRLVLTEKAEVIDDKLHVIFSRKNIDDLTEAGVHKLQIHLYDNEDNRFTIPPVDLHVLLPVGIDNNLTDEAIVGYSLLDREGEDVPAFDEVGNYNKTEWEKGDIITKNKLNKIEGALYEINAANKDFITEEGLETALNDIETQLANKADAAHGHTAVNISGLATVATTGSYNDLSDKPSLSVYATKTELAGKASTSHSHSNYATRSELSNKANTSHTHSDYALKTEIPTVPTKLGDLTNDKGYITSAEIPANYVTETELSSYNYITKSYADGNFASTDYVKAAINQAIFPEGDSSGIDLSAYALKSEIPTRTSQLTNNSGFITTTALIGYATESYVNNTIDERLGDFDVDLTNYYTKEEMTNILADKSDSNHEHAQYSLTDHRHDDIYALKEEIPTIPTNVSDFTNDAGYITEDTIDTVMDQISNNLVDNYAAKEHTHDNYANVSHNHNNDYSNINHNHNNDYAGINHNHNNYATQADIQNMVTSNTIREIRIVNALPENPEDEEQGVLYIVITE